MYNWIHRRVQKKYLDVGDIDTVLLERVDVHDVEIFNLIGILTRRRNRCRIATGSEHGRHLELQMIYKNLTDLPSCKDIE